MKKPSTLFMLATAPGRLFNLGILNELKDNSNAIANINNVEGFFIFHRFNHV